MGLAAVIAVSLLPQSQLPSVSIWDKLQHALSYGVPAARVAARWMPEAV